MRYPAAAVLKGIAGPNGAIGIVQAIAVGIVIAFFPGQGAFNGGPQFFLPRLGCLSI